MSGADKLLLLVAGLFLVLLGMGLARVHTDGTSEARSKGTERRKA